MTCKHCAESIAPYNNGTHHIHTTGMQAGKNTCALNPYGAYHAEPLAPTEYAHPTEIQYD